MIFLINSAIIIRSHFRILIYLAVMITLQLIRRSVPVLNFFYFPELFFLTLFLAEASYRLTITFCRVSGIRNAFSCNAFTDKNYIPVITGVFFIVFIILNHLMFRAFTFEWFDLGLINQALWNTAHGRILEITDATVIQNRNWPNYSMLSGHVEWIFLVIAPLVKFVRNPELLLLIKIAALTCPILLLNSIARKYLTKLESFAVTILYVLFTPLHFILLKDFNADPLAIPFLFAAYLYYIRGKHFAFWFCLVMALSCKEYVSFVLIAIACSLLIRFKDRKNGLLCIITGIVYFILCYCWINPVFNPTDHQSMLSLHYSHIGGNDGFAGIFMRFLQHPMQIIKTVFSNGDEIFYLLMPLLFLPFFDKSTLLAMIILLPKDLLIGLNISSHRLSLLIPFLFIGFIEQIKNFSDVYRKKIIFYSLISSLVAAYFYGPTPLGHRFWKELYKYVPDKKDLAALELISMIPDNVPISVTPSFTPYSGHREIIYQYPYLGKVQDSSRYAHFILYDTADGAFSWKQNQHFNPDSLLKIAFDSGFRLITQKSGIYLLAIHNNMDDLSNFNHVP